MKVFYLFYSAADFNLIIAGERKCFERELCSDSPNQGPISLFWPFPMAYSVLVYLEVKSVRIEYFRKQRINPKYAQRNRAEDIWPQRTLEKIPPHNHMLPCTYTDERTAMYDFDCRYFRATSDYLFMNNAGIMLALINCRGAFESNYRIYQNWYMK